MSYFNAVRQQAAIPAGIPDTSPGPRWERPVVRLRRAEGRAVTAADIRASRRPCRETYSRLFSARLSPYLSAGLLNMGVSPNTVTAAMLPVGLLGALLFVLDDTPTARVFGALLFVLLNLLDTVDGEMARHTGRTSAIGVLLDKVAHVVTDFALFSAVGLALYWQTGLTVMVAATWALVLATTLDLVVVEATRRLTGRPGSASGGGLFQAVAGNVAFYHLFGLCVLADVALAAVAGAQFPVVQFGYFLFMAVAHVGKTCVRFVSRMRLLAAEGSVD